MLSVYLLSTSLLILSSYALCKSWQETQSEWMRSAYVTFGFLRNPDVAEEERGGAEAGPAVVIDYQ